MAALLVAEGFSVTGSVVTRMALPWFVLVSSGSAGRMAVVLAAQMGAMALSGVVSGAAAAGLGARRVLLVGDAVRGVLIAVVPVMHGAGVLRWEFVVAVAAGIGLFFTPHHSARLVLLPALCGKDEGALARANSVLQAVNRGSLLLGPPIAGVLIGVVGAASVLWIDVASFAVSFVLVFLFVRVDRDVAGVRAAGFWVGLRTVAGGAVLRPWTIAMTCFEAVWQFVVATVPLLTYLYFGGSARTVGLLMATIGVGAITGNLLSLRLARRPDLVRLILTGTAVQTVVFWCMTVTADPLTFGFALLIAAFALGLVEGPLTAEQINHIPAAVRAQTVGAFFSITLLGAAAGALAAPAALDRFGPHTAFLSPAILHTTGTITLALALHRLRTTPPPTRTAPEPA
ncbi:macrolide resistance MFS transporter Mrx(A) [Actinocorallia lasiicapitis]